MYVCVRVRVRGGGKVEMWRGEGQGSETTGFQLVEIIILLALY